MIRHCHRPDPPPTPRTGPGPSAADDGSSGPVAGELIVQEREQTSVEQLGHETHDALDLVPDAVLRDGLFAGLVDRLRSAGLRDDQVRDLTCPALTLRVTGYRYVHVLLVLGVTADAIEPIEAHTPNTITSYLLDLLVDLEPTIGELGDRGLLRVDPTNVYGVPRPLQDLGLMKPCVDTYLYDRHIVLSGTERVPHPADRVLGHRHQLHVRPLGASQPLR
jgi:hypothetical protein